MSRDIPIDLLDPNPNQPRKHFTGLEELAASLRDEGQQTALLVRPIGDRFEIVQGERRWRAALLAGLPTLSADVRELSNDEAFQLALVENLQRADLTPIEEGGAFQQLLDGGMTQDAVGRLVGRSQSYVAQKLRLLRAPKVLTVLAAQGALSEGHVRELLRLERLYPEGLSMDCTQWRDIDQSELRTVRELAECYIVMRPEDNPQLPLWHSPVDLLTECEHLNALYDSMFALMDWREEGRVPQWVLAAWWYAAGAVVFDLPVAHLSRLLDLWHRRYISALVWHGVAPKDPGVPEALRGTGSKAEQAARDSSSCWWAIWSDLRHSNSLGLGLKGEMHAYGHGGYTHPEQVFPSALQAWGFQHDVAERILARDAERA